MYTNSCGEVTGTPDDIFKSDSFITGDDYHYRYYYAFSSRTEIPSG